MPALVLHLATIEAHYETVTDETLAILPCSVVQSPRLGLGIVMALQITRGLFRLWLLFSVLWIAGVAVETWWAFPVNKFILPSDLDFIPDEYANEFAAYKACVGTGKSADECVAIACKGTAPPPGFTLDQPWAKRADQCVASLKPPDKERHSVIQTAFLLAPVPPAFVLAFGSALVWAIRGFRADTGTPS